MTPEFNAEQRGKIVGWLLARDAEPLAVDLVQFLERHVLPGYTWHHTLMAQAETLEQMAHALSPRADMEYAVAELLETAKVKRERANR